MSPCSCHGAGGWATSVLGVVEPGQPGGEALDRRLELRVHVGELLQALGDPRQGDFFVTPALLELLDTAVGEVHDRVSTARCPRPAGPRRRRPGRAGPSAPPGAAWPRRPTGTPRPR